MENSFRINPEKVKRASKSFDGEHDDYSSDAVKIKGEQFVIEDNKMTKRDWKRLKRLRNKQLDPKLSELKQL